LHERWLRGPKVGTELPSATIVKRRSLKSASAGESVRIAQSQNASHKWGVKRSLRILLSAACGCEASRQIWVVVHALSGFVSVRRDELSFVMRAPHEK